MCGICGLIDLNGQDRADPALVQRMADLIRHRGPDGDGFYTAANVALGMRRLSIIDVAGSDQPLYNEDRSIALVFNGEIYNYRELRADLIARGHRPHTEGDGETIIHLYEEHGLDLFRYLRGMYAFALWDRSAQRLVLAVDHIGMKPLYLHQRDGKLLFASEVKAFFADPATPRGLNVDVLDTYLSFGYMIGAETLFEGVTRLPPGHALVAEKGETRIQRYWQFPDYVNNDESVRRAGFETLPYNGADDSDIVASVRAALAESVHLHLRSDVPLGLFLSGGINSAAVLALMAQEAQGRIKTFTIGYAMQTPDNELVHARRIAQHFQTEHVERIIDAETWWEGLLRYVYAHDEPNANPSAVSLLLLSEVTAQQVKVVLTGLGGDELFGGYPHHRLMPALIRAGRSSALPGQGLLAALEAWYPAMKRYRIIGALPTYLPRLRQTLLPRDEGLMRMHSFDGMVFSDSLRRQLYGPALSETYRRKAYADIIAASQCADAEQMALALVINTWLTGNALLSQDKTAMAHALEARVPFFDPALLKLAAQVPPALRMKSNKYVLRAAMQPYLPDFALQRPKQPFSTPIMRWFEADLSGRIQDILRDSGAASRQYFDARGLDRLLDAHFSGTARHTEVLFRLLLLELWQRRFVEDQAL